MIASNEEQSGEMVFNAETGEFLYLPNIIYFSADRYFFSDERPVTIVWAVAGASIIKLNGETVETEGTKSFHSDTELNITLYISNGDGEKSETLTIGVDNRPPIIHFFRTDMKFGVARMPIILSWDTERAKKIELNNNIGDVSQLTTITVPLHAESDGHFVLTAESRSGITTTAHLAISVFPTPLIHGVFMPYPKLNIKKIAEGQPVFNIDAKLTNFVKVNSSITVNSSTINVHPAKITIKHPRFTRLDRSVHSIILKKQFHHSVLFTNNIFRVLAGKQKGINHIIKALWEKLIQ